MLQSQYRILSHCPMARHSDSLRNDQSDVLIPLDCCAATSAGHSVDTNGSVIEMISASGFETWAPGVRPNSFSASLIRSFEDMSTGPPFTAAILHNEVHLRVKGFKPGFWDNYIEQRKAPCYNMLPRLQSVAASHCQGRKRACSPNLGRAWRD